MTRFAPLRPYALALATAMLVTIGAATARAASAPSPRHDSDGPAVAAVSRSLGTGARGADVRALQQRLASLSYLPASGVDGAFGMQTWHAVVAFQGWHRLVRDGVAGPVTRRALSRARRPASWSTAPGFEIHIAQQVLLIVKGGRVQRAIHVSTGAGGTTPSGHFRISRREAMSWSVLFHVWMPLAQYFDRGFAIHEYAPVPAYPASHGCVRVPSAESRAVWAAGAVGMRVWTRGR